MDDLIRRQDAIEAIRKIEEVYFNNLPTLLDKASVQTELMMLPSAEQDIITCVDCRYAENQIADGRYWCDLHGTFMRYCSDVKRREG